MIRIADLKLPLGRDESLLKNGRQNNCISLWNKSHHGGSSKNHWMPGKKIVSIMSAWWMWLWTMKPRCWQG